MRFSERTSTLLAILAAATFIGGCNTTGGGATSDGSSKPSAATTTTPSQLKIGPGMNDRGEVIDPKKAESGYGQIVKGMDGIDGEITGKLAQGSKFSQLQIGMSLKQVMDIAGPPTDRGTYVTGRAFIPFYFGGDRARYEVVYKGMGRLIFTRSAMLSSGMNLIWIIHSSNETGYR